MNLHKIDTGPNPEQIERKQRVEAILGTDGFRDFLEGGDQRDLFNDLLAVQQEGTFPSEEALRKAEIALAAMEMYPQIFEELKEFDATHPDPQVALTLEKLRRLAQTSPAALVELAKNPAQEQKEALERLRSLIQEV
jgi:hypothetical protein